MSEQWVSAPRDRIVSQWQERAQGKQATRIMNNKYLDTEIVLEGGPFDGQTRMVCAGEIILLEALETITPDTPDELTGLFEYRRAGRLRDGKPVFAWYGPITSTGAKEK